MFSTTDIIIFLFLLKYKLHAQTSRFKRWPAKRSRNRRFWPSRSAKTTPKSGSISAEGSKSALTPAPPPKVCLVTLFKWPSHRLQGVCPPYYIRVLPPGVDGCICDHFCVSWTLCNAVYSISLAPSAACRAFHIVVMWQPCPTFSNFSVCR